MCTDIGPVAKQYPDVNFLIYHSGWIPGQPEGPYDPDRNEGLDGLIRSVEAAGLGHGSNVYPELGSTWRGLMRDADSAAHAIGKLVKHFGEDNVLWGTDSIWYGSPQDQIQAFRAFQIDKDVRDEHGYSEMTDQLPGPKFSASTRSNPMASSWARRRCGQAATASHGVRRTTQTGATRTT